MRLCGACPGASISHQCNGLEFLPKFAKGKVRIENEQCIDPNVGNYIWLNRFRIFCLWQKAKSNYSDFKRHRANGFSLFYLKHIYYDSFRCFFDNIALFYKNMSQIFGHCNAGCYI